MAMERDHGEASHSQSWRDVDDVIGEQVTEMNATKLRAGRSSGGAWFLPASRDRWRGDHCCREYPQGSVRASAAGAVGNNAAGDLGSVGHGRHV